MLLRGRSKRLTFFDVVNSGKFNRHRTGIMRIVDRPRRNHETVAGLYMKRRLTLDQDIALPFDDIADLFTGMSMPSRESTWCNRDARDYRLMPTGYVLRLHDSALNAGIL